MGEYATAFPRLPFNLPRQKYTQIHFEGGQLSEVRRKKSTLQMERKQEKWEMKNKANV